MLRLRICPHCQEEIRSPKVYFCHRCGAELPTPPNLPEADSGPVETGHAPSLPKKPKLKIVAAAFIIALAAAAGVGVYYFQTNSSRPSLPPPPSSLKNEAFVADVNFAVANHPFSAKGLSEIVPADVDLYLESVDPEILLPSLVSAEEWSKVESLVNDQLGLNVGEAASFLEDEFAVIQESTASAFLSRVRDADFVEQKISEIGDYDGWSAQIVNGFLVVANSPDLIQAIEEAQKKLTLNLSLTSGFAEARQKLPPTGQMFYYGKKRLDFMPESLKGDAFVVSKKEEGALITGL